MHKLSASLMSAVGLALIAQFSATASSSAGLASRVESTGIGDGLLVLVGGGQFNVDEAISLSRRFVVNCLDSDAQRVQRNRNAIQAKGLYGQITAEFWPGKKLPYLDNPDNRGRLYYDFDCSLSAVDDQASFLRVV